MVGSSIRRFVSVSMDVSQSALDVFADAFAQGAEDGENFGFATEPSMAPTRKLPA
jgi:hypothetical protein